ncbi:universal stress protein [Rhodoferax sp.]|jgi:nucleotide-binding universal stress UspA family protein|uniref:universal stress protein n=1 Tax=Rhodoferax sp. TaxID=50421 RepID=UPI003784F209
MKILLAIDGSEFSKRLLVYVCNHASLFGKDHQYTLLNVQTALPSRARSALGKEVVEGYYAEESGKVISAADKFLLRHGIGSKGLAKVGPAASTIAKVASQGRYDLLVMGSHGHGALATLVMGSVATQVVAQCKVPVLLVR